MTADSASVWITRSDLDGYFVAIFVSPRGDHAEARRRAWEIYTKEGNRPDPDEATGEPEWKSYHTDARGLALAELGDSYIGSDGEGHLEVDYPTEAEFSPTRCEQVDPQRGRCALPIGHGSDFQHDWERA